MTEQTSDLTLDIKIVASSREELIKAFDSMISSVQSSRFMPCGGGVGGRYERWFNITGPALVCPTCGGPPNTSCKGPPSDHGEEMTGGKGG